MVLLKTESDRTDGKIRQLVFSVETEVALHQKSQMWFPTKVHYQAAFDGQKKQEEITEFQIVSLNEPIPESTFTFKGLGVPVGHRVMDLTDTWIGTKTWDGEEIISRPVREGPPRPF